MTVQKKKTLITVCVVLLAVLLAYSFRLIGRGNFYPTLFSYLRSFIYIGMYAAWSFRSASVLYKNRSDAI